MSATIDPGMRGAANVVAGWLGLGVPPMPKQRNKTRAGYRKTDRKREPQCKVGSYRSRP